QTIDIFKYKAYKFRKKNYYEGHAHQIYFLRPENLFSVFQILSFLTICLAPKIAKHTYSLQFFKLTSSFIGKKSFNLSTPSSILTMFYKRGINIR
ncbi:unnamed protein product, partial [Allacma fusca]